MASSIEIPSSGYDVQVVGDYPQQLNCGICMFIMKNAMHGCTKHVFCKGCIMKHIECGFRVNGNIMCPGGCRKVVNLAKLEPIEFVDRMINCLTTKCTNEGCNWQGDLLDLVQDHQLSCEHILQSCVNNGCNEKYLKKDLLQHNEVCSYKLIGCTYCHTDIIRINKEKHEVGCLNEKVKSIYYEIGCKNELYRRDLPWHEKSHQTEHIRFIYISLINCKNELLISNDEIKVLKQENVAFKQENAALKQKNIVIQRERVILKKDTTQLKQQVKTIETELQGIKKENRKLIDKYNHVDMDASSETDTATSEPVSKRLRREINSIYDLKRKLLFAGTLRQKVSLVNDDKVMIIKSNKEYRVDFNIKNISDCYKEKDFQYRFDKFDLKDDKSLMMKLLNKVPYHLYDDSQSFIFVFPIDLQNIKDIEVEIPDIYKIQIKNKELTVEQLHENTSYFFLFVESNEKKMNLQREELNQVDTWKGDFNLRDLEKYGESTYAPGYAFIQQ